MLTVSQVATVAFRETGTYEPMCPDCATRRYGPLAVARAEANFDSGLTKVSEYELGEHESEDAWAQAESMTDEGDLYKITAGEHDGRVGRREETDTPGLYTMRIHDDDGLSVLVGDDDLTLADTDDVYQEFMEDYHASCEGCGRLWTGGGPHWTADPNPKREVQPGDQRWLW